MLRQDLKETFIDSGVMSAITEWISPLPDKSLPALRIREELLRILQEVRVPTGQNQNGNHPSFSLTAQDVSGLFLPQLPSVSQETLKHSKIGRAVMFLYKHPKESRPNKDLALKLISKSPPPAAAFSVVSVPDGRRAVRRRVVAAHLRPDVQL